MTSGTPSQISVRGGIPAKDPFSITQNQAELHDKHDCRGWKGGLTIHFGFLIRAAKVQGTAEWNPWKSTVSAQ
eukprot:5699696-Amphidinium_carterae.1